MSIRIRLPKSMTGMASGKTELEVKGTTVGECLDQLTALLPRVKEELFYGDGSAAGARSGKLRSTVRVKLNRAMVEGGLPTPVRDGDELEIKLDRH
jgi:molybdopterin converting factor small subunit